MVARSTRGGAFSAFACRFGGAPCRFGAGSSPHPASSPSAIREPSAGLQHMRVSCPVQLEPDTRPADAPPVGELLDQVEAPAVWPRGIRLEPARDEPMAVVGDLD